MQDWEFYMHSLKSSQPCKLGITWMVRLTQIMLQIVQVVSDKDKVNPHVPQIYFCINFFCFFFF